MKFYTGDKILKKQAQYNLIFGGRGVGKSTWFAGWLIKQFKETGRKFILIFRKQSSFRLVAETWFDAYNQGGNLYSEETADEITFDGQDFYLNGEFFGTTAIISMSYAYRGRVFDPKIYYGILEEFVGLSPDEYVQDETQKFFSLLTTIFRSRDRQIFLLGNSYNEYSKTNPYFQRFGINLTNMKMKVGDIKVIRSKKFKNGAKVALEWTIMHFTEEDEIPLAERIEANDVAITGNFGKVWDIFEQNERYADVGLSFLRDSIDNYYFCDDMHNCYYFVVNDDKQCIDVVSTEEDLTTVGQNGNEEEYTKLTNYPDFYISMFGETDYYKRLNETMPYETTCPLYDGETRYGANCLDFMSGIRRNFAGYTFVYCDSNAKNIYENIIERGKMT